ncbi:unnamed protein product [Paramecium sonneborni]|uniref:Uncharacterized protein n=1 Tax=Paramecium sonneborni TaxID=65129 RepID=A0A8S1KD66_9CILI|nr:unnamed protein product [Paramecium sonneborni]
MDNTQYANISLVKLKREGFRNKLRKELLEKMFEQKRGMKIQAMLDHMRQIQESKNYDPDSDQNQISEESNNYFEVFLIGNTSKKIKLTDKILKSMKLYIMKNTSYKCQILKVFKFCEVQLLESQVENIECIPLLAEIIFLLQNYQNKPQPMIVLLRAFAKHQQYSILQFIESLIFHNPILIKQLEEFCQIKDDQNFIKLLCEKITYANLKMILFLLNTIKSQDLIQLFEFYGLKNILKKKTSFENYGKLRFQILSKAGWNENQSDNQSYQIFGDASNVY